MLAEQLREKPSQKGRSDHAVKMGLKYPPLLTTSQQRFVAIKHLYSLTLHALMKVLIVHKTLLRECWSRRPFKTVF